MTTGIQKTCCYKLNSVFTQVLRFALLLWNYTHIDIASFPGPAKLSVAFSYGKVGGVWEQGYVYIHISVLQVVES